MNRLGKLGVLVGLCAAGFVFWRDHRPAPAAPREAQAVPVTAALAKAEPFAVYRSTIGTVQAYNSVTVRARVDGQLEKVLFTEGQDVKAGDVLAIIDQRPFQAALEQAEAMQAKDLAQLANQKRDLQRYVALNDYATKQQTDTQRTLVSSTQATLLGDQAAIDNAKVQLGFTTIIAPISGRTGARLVDAGNMIKASEGVGLLTIQQLTPIYVTFTLPQDLFDEVTAAARRGAVPVEAYKRDDKAKLATGTLTLIDNQIDPATGTIRLKATFPNADRRLWPGEFVNVHVITSVAPDAVTIPREAAQTGPDGRFVYVIGADDKVSVRPIVDGPGRDGRLMVESGLKPGEAVVVDGQSKLRDESTVAIQNDVVPRKTASE